MARLVQPASTLASTSASTSATAWAGTPASTLIATLGLLLGQGSALAQQQPTCTHVTTAPNTTPASTCACQPQSPLPPHLASACADTLAAAEALAQGDLAHAQVMVELVLLNTPEWAPAHLLQVQLWLQTGNTAAAQDLASQLALDVHTPPAVRASLQALLHSTPAPAAPAQRDQAARPTGTMRVDIGRDTNPAMLLSPGSVTLTFDGVDVALQPAAESTARTVSTLRTALAVVSPNQHHMLEAQHQAGQSARQQSLRYSHMLAGASAWSPTWVRVGWLQDTTQAQRYTLESYWATPQAGHWHLRWQHQVQLSQLNAVELRWLAPLGRKGWWFNTWVDVPPNTQRPGGTRAGVALTGHMRKPWGSGTLEASATAQLVADTQGYSPLLANNARRSVRALSARMAYQHPLSPRTQLEAALEYERTHSNLAVFTRSRQGAYMGLRRSF